jgi:alkanesulfonate monooxygenase SsuD/methylene tetrahydromethanopterin reductase-like flavin-dependent oxidoreductase (luciferase family)
VRDSGARPVRALSPRLAAERPFGLGLNLPYVERSMAGRTPRWSDIRDMALAGERIGFDALWVSDHVGFGDPAGQWTGAWESSTLLAALASITTRVHLGHYVAAAPYRNAALFAKAIETLDEVSGGRAIAALGAGWNEPEFRSYGFPWKRRFDRFEDALRIVTAMLRDGRATHEGRQERAWHARLEPRGPRPGGVPVMVGATGPRMLRLTAELADDWNAGLRTPEECEPLVARIEAACADVGRDPETLTRSAEVLVRTLPAADGAEPEHRELRGASDEVAAALRRYADLGFSHLQVQLRPNSLEGVEGFAPVIEALGPVVE